MKRQSKKKKQKFNSYLLQLRPDASKTQHANNDMKRKEKTPQKLGPILHSTANTDS